MKERLVVVVIFIRRYGYGFIVTVALLSVILTLNSKEKWPNDPDMFLKRTDFTLEAKAEDSAGNVHKHYFQLIDDYWDYSEEFGKRVTGVRGVFQAAAGWNEPLTLTIVGTMVDGTEKQLYRRTVESGERAGFDTKIDADEIIGVHFTADGKFITSGFYWNGTSDGSGKVKRSFAKDSSGAQLLTALGYWSKTDTLAIGNNYSKDVTGETHGVAIFSDSYEYGSNHSSVEYLLNKNYTSFEGTLYHPEATKGKGNGDGAATQAFKVYGDGKLLYSYSDEVVIDNVFFQVDVTNVRILRIQIQGTIDSGNVYGPSVAAGDLIVR